MIIAIISTITILIELIKVIKILCTKIAKRNAAYNEMKRIRETTNTETQQKEGKRILKIA